MIHERINLGNSGYGTRDAMLTAYVQKNLGDVSGRRRPAVIICPGGGYEYQSDRESEPIALEFLRRGYQAFVLEYTILEETETQTLLPYPQMDLAKAIAYVKEYQESWHIDSDKITILGCSAGGNLCALYSGFCQQDWFAEKTGYSKEQLRVQSAILCYPVIDFRAGWPKEEGVHGKICEEAAWEGAQELVTEETPRTFIWHTNTDGTVPAENTLLYAQALLKHGVDAECHLYHRGCHGLSLANEQTKVREEHRNPHVAGWIDTAMEWLEEVDS